MNQAGPYSGPSNIYLPYRQPELTKRARGRLVIKVDEVVGMNITNSHISYEEPDVAELTRGLRDSGQTPEPRAASSGTPPQSTRGDMMGRRQVQRQVRVKTLVAVMIIEDNDRKEQ
jgi:hypothetical protein